MTCYPVDELSWVLDQIIKAGRREDLLEAWLDDFVDSVEAFHEEKASKQTIKACQSLFDTFIKANKKPILANQARILGFLGVNISDEIQLRAPSVADSEATEEYMVTFTDDLHKVLKDVVQALGLLSKFVAAPYQKHILPRKKEKLVKAMGLVFSKERLFNQTPYQSRGPEFFEMVITETKDLISALRACHEALDISKDNLVFEGQGGGGDVRHQLHHLLVSLVREILNVFTKIITFGQSTDRNYLAEANLNRPFFFMKPSSTEEKSFIALCHHELMKTHANLPKYLDDMETTLNESGCPGQALRDGQKILD